MARIEVSFDQLSPVSRDQGMNELGQDFMRRIEGMRVEGHKVAREAKSRSSIAGPAAGDEISWRESSANLRDSLKAARDHHLNIAQYSIVSSVVHSFSGNLNSFLRGQ